MTLLLPGRRRLVLGVAGGAIAVLLIGGLAGPVAARLGTSAGASPLQTFIDRIPIWSAAVSMFVQHPIFGLGLDNFGNYISSYDPSLDVNQAHDLFLNIAAERGLIGLITFGILPYRPFSDLDQRPTSRPGRDLSGAGGRRDGEFRRLPGGFPFRRRLLRLQDFASVLAARRNHRQPAALISQGSLELSLNRIHRTNVKAGAIARRLSCGPG